MTSTVQGVRIPDSKLAREITELVRDTERKPKTTFGDVKADVLADKDPTFKRGNFCSVIRESAWSA